MFLVILLILVLVSLGLSLKEGFDYTTQNEEKYSDYQKLKDAYQEYIRILDLQIK